MTGGTENAKPKQVAPADTASGAGKLAPADGGNSPSKVAGEGAPNTKANELPPSAPGADLEKAGGNTLVDPALFDPNLDGTPESPFRTGKSKTAARFPTWQDPELAERNRAMGMDLLTSPLYSPPSEEASGGVAFEQTVEEPTPFIVPGFLGRAPNVLFPGQGRTAWPWDYHWGISLINGYDSNGFQVPDNGLTSLSQEQGGSFTTGVGLNLDMEWANAHSIFTLTAAVDATYYWSRSKDRTQFNIPTWALLYSTQLGSKTQLSVNFSLNILSQPDFSNVYASQSGGGDSYLTTSSQVNLTHRWAQHFSTDTSLALNLIYYPDGDGNAVTLGSGSDVSSNQLNVTLGNAFRFETSTKLTWVVDGRYQVQEVFDDSALGSDTIYFLGGLDWIWLRHLTASVRAGGSFRTSDTFGNSTSPYLELSGNYRTGRYSSLILNARYGFQFSDAIGNDSPSFSVGVNYQQTLGRRLSGTAGIDYYRNSSSDVGSFSSTSQAVDFRLGLQYQVSRHFSWGAQYTFTQSDSSSGQQDFNRSVGTLSARWGF